MKGSMSHEQEVGHPASEIWEVYSTLRLANLILELLPHIVTKLEVIEGDGGVGTVILTTLPSGSQLKEKFVRIDDQERVKVVEIMEGGYLDFGFTSFVIRFEIVDKKCGETCIIRTNFEYEFRDEDAASVPTVSTATYEAIAEAISKYLMEKKDSVIHNKDALEGDNKIYTHSAAT